MGCILVQQRPCDALKTKWLGIHLQARQTIGFTQKSFPFTKELFVFSTQRNSGLKKQFTKKKDLASLRKLVDILWLKKNGDKQLYLAGKRDLCILAANKVSHRSYKSQLG